MADFSYRQGFKMNELTVDNKNANNIYLLDVVEKATPNKVLYEDDDLGDEIDTGKHEKKLISLTVGINENSFMARTELLAKILNNVTREGRLYFIDDPERYYDAKVLNEIDKVFNAPFLELSIPLRCSSYLYRDAPKTQLVGTVKVVNEGNVKAETLLEVTATGNTVTIGAQSISGFTGTMYIDSKDMVAYTIVNGIKQNALQYVNGDVFLTLLPGENSVTTSGGTVKISYRHTYLF